MKTNKIRSILMPALHPVYDQHRIRLLRVLLVIGIPLLAIEMLTAFYMGINSIAFFELATVLLLVVFSRLFWKKPHYFGNIFILFSFIITTISIVDVLENPAVLLFLLALPTFYIYYLGLLKGILVTCSIVLMLGAATVNYVVQHGSLPWPYDYFIFSWLVFIIICVFTIAYARTNTLLLTTIRQKAERDELTKVYTRRTFFELLHVELHRAERHASSFSLVLWDVDHFKKVNDEHGHQTGDEVLRIMARTCARSLRKSDIVGRVGGEEFACLLPETGGEAAGSVAEKIRRAISASNGGGLPACSVSLGVAEFSPGDTRESLYRRADQALYAAKSAGRDCVKLG